MKVRVVIPARDEEARLAALLRSVQGLDAEIVVVLDRCRDATARIAKEHGARVLHCPAPGGKVEALRAGMRDADIYVCIDADVVLGARTLQDLVAALVLDSRLRAACPPLAPEPSRWHTPLSWALYRYNAARGFSSERLWLSGRCYAVRPVEFPTHAEVLLRAAKLRDPWQRTCFSTPLIADDVWLSRALAGAIAHVETDPVRYLPPRTLRGMSRTYRRLRRELARIDALFPELASPGRDRRVETRGRRDRVALALFNTALLLCRAHAALEDAAERLGHTPDPWPRVFESKR